MLPFQADKETGMGYVFQGIHDAGNVCVYEAVVTSATLDLLRNLGIANYRKRLGISLGNPYILHASYGVSADGWQLVDAVMMHGPMAVGTEHVVWERVNNFYKRPNPEVIPPSLVVVEMLEHLGLSVIPGIVYVSHLTACDQNMV